MVIACTIGYPCAAILNQFVGVFAREQCHIILGQCPCAIVLSHGVISRSPSQTQFADSCYLVGMLHRLSARLNTFYGYAPALFYICILRPVGSQQIGLVTSSAVL